MEEELKHILIKYKTELFSDVDTTVKSIFDLFGVSKLDLCKTCQSVWIGYEEEKKVQRKCISCKGNC